MSKLVPAVSVDLDRLRALVCDMAAVAQFEEWFGKSLFDIMAEIGAAETDDEKRAAAKQLERPKAVNCMLAAFLLREDPQITPQAAGRLLDTIAKVSLASAAVGEATSRFFGVAVAATATEAASPENAQPLIPSGPSPDMISA